LIDVRGSGSMATVYVSRDLDSNRIFAVKVLRPEIANQGEFLERFHREAQILMFLTDPHIVRPVEYGDDGDVHYIVMDYVDGTTLKEQIIASAPFPLDRAIDVALQAAEGLNAAFMQKKVVHRDVKPQNILVTTKNVIKLTDFGMARAQESVTLTGSNVFMGTPFYVAPEQADDGRNADIRSDLYSLACVLFEMLTGQVPYDGTNAVDVVVKHVRNPVPSVCELRPDLPAALDNFLQKAMAKAPGQRFQTPVEFIQKLEELKQQIGPASSLNGTQNRASVGPSPVVASPPPEVERPRLTLMATGQIIYLTGNQAIIGRSDPHRQIYPEVDLSTLDTDRMVSRRQARVLQHDGRYFVEDLRALNVTKLNGTPLRPNEERELSDGDILRAGNIEMRFSLRDN
ncbi:MAG TPA: FHA domain-containing serine/threonine-protein kinase, partial [Ktedonobacterales bacterium]|nr:FHA domain-containing serine/threonine-protein kinase [Ktedonobacterales bacterium]